LPDTAVRVVAKVPGFAQWQLLNFAVDLDTGRGASRQVIAQFDPGRNAGGRERCRQRLLSRRHEVSRSGRDAEQRGLVVARNRGAIDKVIQIERSHPIGKAGREAREPDLVLPPLASSGVGRFVPYVSRDEAIEIPLETERQVEHVVVTRYHVGEERRVGSGIAIGADVVLIEEGFQISDLAGGVGQRLLQVR
jgi:hypothetical protein